MGLNYLHQHKPELIIHRDLEPSNILRDDSGHLKVANFGLSKLQKAAKFTKGNRSMAFQEFSWRYVAPEVFRNEEYDTKVYVFSFALILQEVRVHSLMSFLLYCYLGNFCSRIFELLVLEILFTANLFDATYFSLLAHPLYVTQERVSYVTLKVVLHVTYERLSYVTQYVVSHVTRERLLYVTCKCVPHVTRRCESYATNEQCIY